MRIGSPRLPPVFNYGALLTRLGEIFGLIDKTIVRVDNGTLFDTRNISASASMNLQDSIVLADASAGTLVYTLLPAEQVTNKRVVVVKTKGSNPVQLDPDGAELIDATSAVALASQFDKVELVSTGSGWLRI